MYHDYTDARNLAYTDADQPPLQVTTDYVQALTKLLLDGLGLVPGEGTLIKAVATGATVLRSTWGVIDAPADFSAMSDAIKAAVANYIDCAKQAKMDSTAGTQAAQTLQGAITDAGTQYGIQKPIWDGIVDDGITIKDVCTFYVPTDLINFGLTPAQQTALGAAVAGIVAGLNKIAALPPIADAINKINTAAAAFVAATDGGMGTPVADDPGPIGPDAYGALTPDGGAPMRFDFTPGDGVSQFLQPNTFYNFQVYDPTSGDIGSTFSRVVRPALPRSFPWSPWHRTPIPPGRTG